MQQPRAHPDADAAPGRWSLFGSLLETVPSRAAAGNFITHRLELNRDYVCGLCRPPSRPANQRKHAPHPAPQCMRRREPPPRSTLH